MVAWVGKKAAWCKTIKTVFTIVTLLTGQNKIVSFKNLKPDPLLLQQENFARHLYGIYFPVASGIKKTDMKNKFTLTIDTPCSEKWEHFTTAAQGAFCNACQKNVIDFTSMSDQEIMRFFKTHPAQTCGRFRAGQLHTYTASSQPVSAPRRQLLYVSFLSALTFFVSKQGHTQARSEKEINKVVQFQDHTEKNISDNPGRIVKGTVIDEHRKPLPGVSIYLKGTSVGVSTNLNGQFTFPEKLKAGDVLVFVYIGYETQEYVVPKSASSELENLSMVLQLEEVLLMGEVAVNHVYVAPPTGVGKWWQKVKSLFQ